jgi:uncharacterized protein
VEVAGFDWDEGNRKKSQEHGVSLMEIEAVFHGTVHVFPDPTHSRGEERFIAIGKTPAGRNVFIAFTLRTFVNEARIRPISARYMHRREVAHYEKEIAKTENR